MDTAKDCKVSACCKTHGCKILGLIFLVIGTILTFITLNGMGIFGMFVAGIVLCCHKYGNKCQCGCCKEQSECETSCDTLEKKTTRKSL